MLTVQMDMAGSKVVPSWPAEMAFLGLPLSPGGLGDTMKWNSCWLIDCLDGWMDGSENPAHVKHITFDYFFITLVGGGGQVWIKQKV